LFLREAEGGSSWKNKSPLQKALRLPLVKREEAWRALLAGPGGVCGNSENAIMGTGVFFERGLMGA